MPKSFLRILLSNFIRTGAGRFARGRRHTCRGQRCWGWHQSCGGPCGRDCSCSPSRWACVLRRSPAARRASRRPARVLAPLRRGADRGARTVRGGGRAVHHGPARGRPAQRGRGRGGDPLQVAARPVVDRHGLRARPRRLSGAAAHRGAADPGARTPARVEAAHAAPAPVLVEPGPDDRPFVGGAVRHRAVGHRPVGAATEAGRCPRRGQRLGLGNA